MINHWETVSEPSNLPVSLRSAGVWHESRASSCRHPRDANVCRGSNTAARTASEKRLKVFRTRAEGLARSAGQQFVAMWGRSESYISLERVAGDTCGYARVRASTSVNERDTVSHTSLRRNVYTRCWKKWAISQRTRQRDNGMRFVYRDDAPG